MADFIICSKCQASLIIEEFDTHQCNHTFRFEGDYLLIRRKGRWRKIHLPSLGIYSKSTENLHREDPTDDFTEPQIGFWVIYETSF